MKRIFVNKISLPLFLILIITVVLYACKKDADGRPPIKVGTPMAITVTPDSGANGAVIALKGTGLGDIRKVVFEKGNVSTSVTSTLNTESSLLFRVPDTAQGGQQNITFTNSAGKTTSISFRVLAYAKVSEVSNYDFMPGDMITLTGINFADVTKVVLTGTSEEVSIVSKTKTTLLIKMPTTTVNRATLDITNATGLSTTKQEFVSIKNNFIAFDDNWGTAAAYGGSVQSWSWGCALSPSTDFSKSGSKSLKVAYTDGGLSMFLGCNWDAANNKTFTTFYQATYLTFWARGNGSDVNITIVPDSPWPGPNMANGPATGSKTITVLKDAWTYFKIPVSFISGGYSRMNFKIEGATGKTVYYDNILFVK